MEHFTVTFMPEGKKVLIHAGAALSEAAGLAGIIIDTRCGGRGVCQKCLVSLEPQKKSVLACQYLVHEDCTVTVPETSRFFETKILTEGVIGNSHIHPTVRKMFLKINSPDEKTVLSELRKFLPEDSFKIGPAVLKGLASLGDEQSRSRGVTLVCHLDSKSQTSRYEYNVVSVEAGDTVSSLFGLAVDIGTTTIVARLIDMASGSSIAVKGAENPQAKFGDDVISRISYAQTDARRRELQKAVTDCLNNLAAKLCREAGIDAGNIYEMCLVGNTTMNHFFLNLPVEQLARAPYRAFSLDAADIPPGNLGLKINPAANIHTVENVAGFVGSDTVAAALAVDIDSACEMTLLVDIGTNGEIVLGTKERLLAASCAAGPAFEGARITCGSRAIDGAIQAVVRNREDIDVDVIGGSSPRSICGSGLIDAVAVLLDLEIVDKSGRFAAPETLKSVLPQPLLSRIIEHNDQPAFILARGSEKSVILTQKDIRETQLAKAAIRTGIKILQKKLGLEDADIKHLLLAGAFGNYIRRESALRIGLLPDIPPERIVFVGNAASSGAQMALLSRKYRRFAGELSRKMKYVEIAHEPDFSDVYADAILF